MRQESNLEKESIKTIVEIPISKIVEFSNTKLISGENAGERVIEQNLAWMKKWSDEEISKIFRPNGSLRGFRTRLSLQSRGGRVRVTSYPKNHPGFRANLVKKTRKLTVAALRLLFEEEKLYDSDFKKPTKLECTRMAKEMISEENIKNKFDQSVIVYDQVKKNY